MTYKTEDLYLASYLKAKGYELHSVKRNPRKNRSVFEFIDHPERKLEVKAFFANTATVSAFEYAVALRMLKGFIRAARAL
jgi:hypothetical protein